MQCRFVLVLRGRKLMGQEWNYMQCNKCYVMFPHLAVPEVCVCGNDMNCNSTRKKFILSFRVKELLDVIKDKCTWDSDEVVSHKWVKNVIDNKAKDVFVGEDEK